MKKKEQDEILKQNEHAIKQKKLEDRDLKRKKMFSKLSFQLGDEDEDTQFDTIKSSASSSSSQSKKVLKNPNVDTSFLPDRDREKELQIAKDKLQVEWLEQQEIMKNEVHSYCYSQLQLYNFLFFHLYVHIYGLFFRC